MAAGTYDVERTAREPGAVLGQWNSAVASYYLIAGATALLTVLGLIMVLSSSSVYSLELDDVGSPYAIFVNHARYALMALPLAWVASRLPVRFYRRMAGPVLMGAVALQMLVVFTPLGKTVGGNRNWLVVPGTGLSIQPGEMVKLALALWLAAVLARKQALLHQWREVLLPGVVVAVAAVGLVLQGHDQGTALILLMVVAGALFAAGVPMWMFAVAGLAASVVMGALASTSRSRVERITAFFSEDCDQAGACYQTTRGLYGLASGGWTGLGLGESREKWSYLPEAHNDFIFAILGEELGLLGTLLVLALFGLLAVAMTRVVRRHTDPFVQIATAGIGAWVLGQALVNIAVVIGLLPVLGVPLPLVSAGGSALITTMVGLGVVLSFARQEPGATEALTARAGVVRRSFAVVGRSAARRGARMTGRDRAASRRGGDAEDGAARPARPSPARADRASARAERISAHVERARPRADRPGAPTDRAGVRVSGAASSARTGPAWRRTPGARAARRPEGSGTAGA